MTDQTKEEILRSALMKLKDSSVATMQWLAATEHEKTLVIGNLNGFCGYLARTMPQ